MTATGVEQGNVTLVQRGFDAFGTGDMAALDQLFHPDATWTATPVGVLGGDLAGRAAIFAMFGQLMTETNGSFRVVPSTFASSSDEVFVRALATGTRNGETIASDEVLIFTLAEGTVRDVRFYMHDYPANAAFWR